MYKAELSARACLFVGLPPRPETQRELRRLFPRLHAKFPDYRLALGFGLHHGWCVVPRHAHSSTLGVTLWQRRVWGWKRTQVIQIAYDIVSKY